MPLLDRILPWRQSQRAATEAVDLVAQGMERFGPGLSQQPSHEVLLRENLGVADIATRAIANRVATLEPQVKVTRRVTGGTTEDEILDDHALKRLLDRPHPSLTRAQLMRLTAQYIVTVGESYWLKIGNRFGIPFQLDPLPPGMVTPLVVQNVVESYLIRDANGREVIKPANTVVRFYFPDPESPFESEGYLGPNAIATDAYKFQTEHLRKHYESNAVAPAWIKAAADAAMPNKEARERFLTEWRQNYNQRRGSKAGLPGFLPPGFDIVLAAMQTGADMTPLLEYFQQQQLMNFGVPASVLGRVISGDRSSAETNQFVFDLHTVKPIADLIADTLTLQLAGDFDPSIWVDFEEFVSDDKEFALKREAQDLQLKLASPNTVLEARGFDPVPWGELPVGTIGDSPYTGEAMAPEEPDDFDALDEPDTEPEEPDNEDEPEEERTRRLSLQQHGVLYERLFSGVLQKSLRSIVDQQRRETLKRLKDMVPRARIDVRDLFEPEEWRRLFHLRVRPILRQILNRAGNDALQAVGIEGTFLFNPTVERLLETEAARMVTRTGTTTQRRLAKQLAEGIGEGESVNQLSSRLSKVFAGRKRDTRTIARTEVLKAHQQAQLEGFRQSGVVTKKRWNTSQDQFVRDLHAPMDGVEVALNEDFNVGGELASHPGDTRLSAGNVINCRCFVVPIP